MAIKRFKVEKLIRDLLPDFMRTKGVVFHERNLEQDEFVAKLKEKLLEEAEEVKKASSAEELVEELADVLEVLHSLSRATGLTMEQIEEVRLQKQATKGGFNRKVYQHYVEIEESNPIIHYYLKKAQQYPEMDTQSHQSDCLFCQIARREREVNFFAIFKHCYVIKDQFPVSNGHLLIIPHEHTLNWFTAPEEVRLDMIKALHFVKERLDAEYAPHGYNIGANCGEVAGQSVMHLHLHLIPRYLGDMENPKGGVRGVIPSKQKY